MNETSWRFVSNVKWPLFTWLALVADDHSGRIQSSPGAWQGQAWALNGGSVGAARTMPPALRSCHCRAGFSSMERMTWRSSVRDEWADSATFHPLLERKSQVQAPQISHKTLGHEVSVLEIGYQNIGRPRTVPSLREQQERILKWSCPWKSEVPMKVILTTFFWWMKQKIYFEALQRWIIQTKSSLWKVSQIKSKAYHPSKTFVTVRILLGCNIFTLFCF